MAYSDFNLETAQNKFGLILREDRDLFVETLPIEPSQRLREVLDEWAPVAIGTNTEKARSEMIIAPILMEIVRLCVNRLRLFSGITFDVDKSLGLSGVCDFILSQSTERFFLRRPVIAIVEAKREDVANGLGQCVAAMVAAKTFNQQSETEAAPKIIHGAVTTGNIWQFLTLEGQVVHIDRSEYHLHQLNKILGILVSMAA